ncbi:MAG: glycoside hydrolase 5 family protein [Armatimonadota bacterium]
MLRHFSIIVFLVSLMMPTSCIYAEPPVNLLHNPGFEMGAKHWLVEGDAIYSPDIDVKYKGKQSLRLAPQSNAKSDLIKVSSTHPAKPDEVYRASFRVFAGPLTDGSEPYGVLEFIGKSGRISLVHTDFQAHKYEPNTWVRLSASGIVPDGATSVRISMIMHPRGIVRFDDAELIRLHPAPKLDTSPIRLTLKPNVVINDDWRGFGVQGEVFVYLQRSIDQGVDDKDRELIKRRIDAMRPKFVRLTVRLSDWEPELGKHTPENDTLKDLKATIAIYKEAGADVQLTEWGHALPEWCRPNGRLPSPDMRKAFTDSWASLLKYLRRDCGLTNVCYVTMHNEPNNLPWADYRAICRSLGTSLKEAGIRNEVSIIGPDEANENLLLPLAIRDLNDVIDFYDAHGYTSNTGRDFGLWVEGKTILMPKTSAANPKRKRLLITEFGMADGMDTWQTPHNDEYGYGLFLADCAVASANLGASVLVMYCISDYDCGTKMKWGLWKSHDEGWEPRPGYYSWSLITRYTELGSSVHPLAGESSSIQGIAFQAPGKDAWTLMAVNRSTSVKDVVIGGLKPGSRWEPFVYSAQTVPTSNREMIKAGKSMTAGNDGSLKTRMPQCSFVLWHEIR